MYEFLAKMIIVGRNCWRNCWLHNYVTFCTFWRPVFNHFPEAVCENGHTLHTKMISKISLLRNTLALSGPPAPGTLWVALGGWAGCRLIRVRGSARKVPCGAQGRPRVMQGHAHAKEESPVGEGPHATAGDICQSPRIRRSHISLALRMGEL